MAIALRDSFIDVHLEEAELTQHVLDVIKARPTGPERRAAIAYLRQIVHRDADDIAHFRYINARARQVLEDREKLHTFDIRSAKHTDLFLPAVGVNYTTLLAVANAEVIADGQTLNQNLTVTGDNASFHGLGTGRRRRDPRMRMHRQRQMHNRRGRRPDRGRRVQGPGGRRKDRLVRRR